MPVPVLLFVRALGIGGIERDVAKIALSLDRSRFQPHVGCFIREGMRYPELRDAEVPVLELPVRSFRSAATISHARLLRRYIREQNIRLIHTYDVPTTEFCIPATVGMRDLAVVSSQLGYRNMFSRIDGILLRATDRLVDRVVVNCEAMRRHMVDDEGFPEQQTYLCYNGVDPNIFFPRKEPRPAGLSDSDLVVGAICALRPEKRLDLLIDAFAKVRHLRPGLRLVIVGSGPLEEALKAQAAALRITDACFFQPATPDVAPWMRAIDIFVLCSDSEAFSNALLESMSSGCCPIGSRVGGTPEMIVHEETGLLFDSGNTEQLAASLSRLILKDELRTRLGQAAACRARQNFSLARAAETMGSLYAALAS